MSFDATCEHLGSGVHRYAVERDGEPLTYADALDCWEHDDAFRRFFVAILSDARFPAYRWETPPITSATVARDFEFVLLDAPWLALPPDRRAFSEHFRQGDTDQGVVAFENLGKDALLVAPSPRGPDSVYGHLAAFVRGAPSPQIQTLWIAVARTAKQALSDRPLWISTAGGGVAWLHVRLDSRPKYYGYVPYTISG